MLLKDYNIPIFEDDDVADMVDYTTKLGNALVEKIKGNEISEQQLKNKIAENKNKIEENRQLAELNYANALKGNFTKQKNIKLYTDTSYLQKTIINGESIQDGEPSLDNIINISNLKDKMVIHIDNRNLLRITLKDGVTNGIRHTVNQDGSIILNGTATAVTYLNLDYDEINSMVVEKDYYTFSNKEVLPVGVRLVLRKRENADMLINFDSGNSKTIKLSYEGKAYGFITIATGTVLNNVIFYPMLERGNLERGNVAGTYVKNSNNKVIIALKREYANEDYIDIDNMLDIQNRSKFVFDGITTKFTFVNNSQTAYDQLRINNNSIKPNTSVMCNMFKNYAPNSCSIANGVFSSNTLDAIYIHVPKGILPADATLEDANAWVKSLFDAGNPLTIEYTLASPIIKNLDEMFTLDNITKLQNLKTHNNITNIYSTAPLSADYNKDIGMLEKRIADLEALISTPSTAALLLQNLARDNESEVK